jgi:hypothetical protein
MTTFGVAALFTAAYSLVRRGAGSILATFSFQAQYPILHKVDDTIYVLKRVLYVLWGGTVLNIFFLSYVFYCGASEA